MSLIPILLVALLGLLVLGIILFAFLGSLFGSFGDIFEKWRLSRHRQFLVKAEAALAKSPSNTDISPALDLLGNSFCFDPRFRRPTIIQQLGEHHEAILGHIIAIAESRQVHLDALPELEELLDTQLLLLREGIDTREARRGLHQKQHEKGKNTPDWAFAEYEKKLTLVGEHLDKNRREAQELIRFIFRSLKNPKSAGNDVYH